MGNILEFKDRDLRTNKIKTVGKMEIKNKTDDFAELYFYGDIVSSTLMKWQKEDKCPQDVVDFLNEVDNVNKLDIHINSGGGSVFGGLAIYNLLKKHNAYKTVYVDGLAASIASVIALVGDRIIIPASAQFMIHQPWTIAIGNAEDFRKLADDLDRIEGSIINVYEEHLKDGVSINTIKQMMKEETWMSGREAAKYFDIETTDDIEAVACVSQYFNYYKYCPNNLTQYSDDTSQTASVDSSKIQKLKLELELLD